MSLYLISGKTCSGKDSIARELIKMGYKRIVSNTTRPMRAGEIDGKDYHFKDIVEDYDKTYCLKSFTVADGSVWRYWLDKDEIMKAVNSDEPYICIVDADGERELRRISNSSFYIKADWEERLRRYYNRESKNEKPNYPEMVRRILADEEDFKQIELEALITDDVTLIINDDISLAASRIDRWVRVDGWHTWRTKRIWCI